MDTYYLARRSASTILLAEEGFELVSWTVKDGVPNVGHPLLAVFLAVHSWRTVEVEVSTLAASNEVSCLCSCEFPYTDQEQRRFVVVKYRGNLMHQISSKCKSVRRWLEHTE